MYISLLVYLPVRLLVCFPACLALPLTPYQSLYAWLYDFRYVSASIFVSYFSLSVYLSIYQSIYPSVSQSLSRHVILGFHVDITLSVPSLNNLVRTKFTHGWWGDSRPANAICDMWRCSLVVRVLDCNYGCTTWWECWTVSTDVQRGESAGL